MRKLKEILKNDFEYEWPLSLVFFLVIQCLLPNDTKPNPSTETLDTLVEFFHSITKTWTDNGIEYHRRKVTVINKRGKPITGLKLSIENLSGPLRGLLPTSEKNVYELPTWLKVLKHGMQFSFVYVQGGPQAKVTAVSCN